MRIVVAIVRFLRVTAKEQVIIVIFLVLGKKLNNILVTCTCAKNAQVVDNNTQKMRVDSGCCAFCNSHFRRVEHETNRKI